ncbi:MAG: glycosyltransferase, partial [Bacteroidia bacterium]
MPKVLRIINRFNLGGITYNVSYLSKYLPVDYETRLIGGAEEAGEESSLHIPLQLGLKPEIIHELKREISFRNDYAAYKKIKQIIREFKPDIVHTHASKAGAVGRLAAISCNVPVIVHTFHGHVFHSYFGNLKTAFYKTIERYLARRSQAIVAISAIQKKELTQVYNICTPEQTHVINLGFDLARFAENTSEKREAFRKKYGIAGDELAIGIIGRLAPIKNHELFIDAIELVRKQSGRKIKALIIGDGETRVQLENYIRSKGMEYSYADHGQALFCFTSWIKEVDVALAGLDIVCLTSKNEGTSVSLIEAQAAGKYSVTTNVGGIADILHPDCGSLSDPNDPQAFCNNLLTTVTGFEALSLRAKNGQARVLEQFSYQRLVRDMKKLYEDLLK